MSGPEPPPRPPIASAALSVVLVAGNAEPSWQEVFGSWENYLAELGREYEILVVNGGAASVAAEHSHVRVLPAARPPGMGKALQTGLAAARNPLLVYASCDPRYRPEDLKRLLERIDAADLVVGCRAGPMPSWLRGIGWLYRLAVRVLIGVPLDPLPSWLGWKNWLYHLWLRVVTGVRLHDVNCGLQIFRRESVAGIPVQATGPFALAELIAKLNFLDCLMDEVEIAGPPEEQPLWPLLVEGHRVLANADFGKR